MACSWEEPTPDDCRISRRVGGRPGWKLDAFSKPQNARPWDRARADLPRGCSSPQQGELARQDAIGAHQPVEIYPAGQGTPLVVAAVPVNAMDPRLYRPWCSTATATRCPVRANASTRADPGRSRNQEITAAVEGIGGVLMQLQFVGQADPLPGQGQQLAPRGIREVVGQVTWLDSPQQPRRPCNVDLAHYPPASEFSYSEIDLNWFSTRGRRYCMADRQRPFRCAG